MFIADDEPEVVDLVQMVLEMEGYAVSSAGDGQAALAGIRAELPDIVLLDVRMPKMSGLKVLEYLQSRSQHGLHPSHHAQRGHDLSGGTASAGARSHGLPGQALRVERDDAAGGSDSGDGWPAAGAFRQQALKNIG